MVEYKLSHNAGDKVFTYNHYLIANNKESFFVMPYHKSFNSYEEMCSDEEYISSIKYNASIHKENGSNILYELTTIPNSSNNILAKDDITHHYEQTIDEENLLGYNCKIAKIKFRGRNYKVWFTQEIPVSEGPWKFYNLPGLILKVEDDKKIYTYIATRVVLNKDYLAPTKIRNLHNDVSTAISYKEFIELQNKFFNEMREKALASLPKSVVMKGIMPALRKDLQEVTFDWEEIKKP